jgi:hypothetical protein
MRTTLTLDDDVAAALERLRKARKLSLKRAVNETLRAGLARMSAPLPSPRKAFRTRPVSLGRCLIGNVDNVAEVLARAEGESFR